MTLVIAASLEVEHGIDNLWKCGASNGFKQYPNYGNYVPQNYFRAFVSGFPQLWSPPHLWHSEHVPWDSFLPLMRAFNRKRGELLRTNYLLMDESMSAWRPKTSKTGGLPNITYEPRKPKPLGTMFKNGVEAMTGIVVNQDVVEGSAAQWEKKYVLQESTLPKKEPIMAHVAEVLRQCEGAQLADGGWVAGDAWFGSIPAIVEVKNRLNVFSTFIVKQNVQYCPLQVIKKILRTRYPKRPAGRHIVMKAKISGVDLFLLAYAWSNTQSSFMISSCGTTVQHEICYRTHFCDDFGNVTFKEIPRPSIAHFYFELSPLIDNHNKDRQSVLGLEDCWPTKNPWFRLVTTMIGMSVVDMHRWDRHKRTGGRAFQWVKDDDEQPDFLKVRSMANLIAKGLHMSTMQYRNTSRKSLPVKRSRRSHLMPLERIAAPDGSIRRDNGTEYQKTCFICRMYKKKQVNVMWCCTVCKMPLCKIDRGRKFSCLQEHQRAHEDEVYGCNEGRETTTFVLPKAYRLYDSKTNDIHEDNDGNDSADEVGSSASFATAVAEVVEEAEATKKTSTKKDRQSRSTRSATSVRRSKRQRTVRVAGL